MTSLVEEFGRLAQKFDEAATRYPGVRMRWMEYISGTIKPLQNTYSPQQQNFIEWRINDLQPFPDETLPQFQTQNSNQDVEEVGPVDLVFTRVEIHGGDEAANRLSSLGALAGPLIIRHQRWRTDAGDMRKHDEFLRNAWLRFIVEKLARRPQDVRHFPFMHFNEEGKVVTGREWYADKSILNPPAIGRFVDFPDIFEASAKLCHELVAELQTKERESKKSAIEEACQAALEVLRLLPKTASELLCCENTRATKTKRGSGSPPKEIWEQATTHHAVLKDALSRFADDFVSARPTNELATISLAGEKPLQAASHHALADSLYAHSAELLNPILTASPPPKQITDELKRKLVALSSLDTQTLSIRLEEERARVIQSIESQPAEKRPVAIHPADSGEVSVPSKQRQKPRSRKGIGGPTKKSPETLEAERRTYVKWKEAEETGTSQKEFARETNIDHKELKKLLERVRKRLARGDRQ